MRANDLKRTDAVRILQAVADVYADRSKTIDQAGEEVFDILWQAGLLDVLGEDE